MLVIGMNSGLGKDVKLLLNDDKSPKRLATIYKAFVKNEYAMSYIENPLNEGRNGNIYIVKNCEDYRNGDWSPKYTKIIESVDNDNIIIMSWDEFKKEIHKYL